MIFTAYPESVRYISVPFCILSMYMFPSHDLCMCKPKKCFIVCLSFHNRVASIVSIFVADTQKQPHEKNVLKYVCLSVCSRVARIVTLDGGVVAENSGAGLYEDSMGSRMGRQDSEPDMQIEWEKRVALVSTIESKILSLGLSQTKVCIVCVMDAWEQDFVPGLVSD